MKYLSLDQNIINLRVSICSRSNNLLASFPMSSKWDLDHFIQETRFISFVGYKIPPAEVCKRPTLPGLFRLPTLCGIFLNPLDHPSFHNTIRTSPTMSFSIHPSGRSKGSLGFAISRSSTVINYSRNPFQTSSGHGRLYSELLSDFISIQPSLTMGFL